MNIDMLGRLALGFHPIGGTEYMWDATHPLTIRLLSLFHVGTPPLLVWALWRLGYDRRAFLLQVAVSWIILPLSFLGGPDKDLNWSWGPFDRAQTLLPAGLYLAVCMAAYPLILYGPSHLALRAIFREGRKKEEPDSTRAS